jgi:hypothetical protein
VHINLLIVALRYWRDLRKREELEVEEGYHFLGYNHKEFEGNMEYLERYAHMPSVAFTNDGS